MVDVTFSSPSGNYHTELKKSLDAIVRDAKDQVDDMNSGSQITVPGAGRIHYDEKSYIAHKLAQELGKICGEMNKPGNEWRDRVTDELRK